MLFLLLLLLLFLWLLSFLLLLLSLSLLVSFLLMPLFYNPFFSSKGIRICMLGLPNKVPYADFMARYSIVAPKIFADMKSDPKGCANKALPHAGLDPDDFRTGHTKVIVQ